LDKKEIAMSISSKKPLVSICVPTYNGEQYLAEALRSALAQTYRPLEIILSDDHSHDNSLMLAAEVLSSGDIPFQIVSHHPSGIGANWNHCVRHASGQYIKFLFQDDILHPDCVAEMVTFAEEKGAQIGLVFCQRQTFGENSHLAINLEAIQRHFPEVIMGKWLIGRSDFYTQPRNKIGEPTAVMLRSDVFETVGYFAENLRQSLDYEFWYRCAAQYQLGFVRKTLVKFRLHHVQATAVNQKQVIADRYRLPWLLLKTHWASLQLKVKIVLIYKIITGWMVCKIS